METNADQNRKSNASNTEGFLSGISVVFVAGRTLLFSRIVGLVLSLASTIILTKALSPAEYGKVAFTITAIVLLAQTLTLGMNTGAIFFSSQLNVSPPRIVSTLLWFGCGVSVLPIITVLLTDPDWLLKSTSHEGWDGLKLGLWGLPFFICFDLFTNFFLGSRRARQYFLILALCELIALTGNVILWRAFEISSAQKFIIIWVLSYLCTAGYCLVYSGKRGLIQPIFDRGLLYRIARFSLYGFVSSWLFLASQRFCYFLISFFSGPEAMGYYALSVVATGAFLSFPSAVSLSSYSHVSTLHGETKSDVCSATCRITIILLAVGLFLAAILGPFFIRILIGAQYTQSVGLLVLMIPGVLANGISTFVANYLEALGYPAPFLKGAIFAFAASMILGPLLVWLWGVNGVSLTYSISNFAYLVGVTIAAIATIGSADVAKFFLPRLSDFGLMWSTFRGFTVSITGKIKA